MAERKRIYVEFKEIKFSNKVKEDGSISVVFDEKYIVDFNRLQALMTECAEEMFKKTKELLKEKNGS